MRNDNRPNGRSNTYNNAQIKVMCGDNAAEVIQVFKPTKQKIKAGIQKLFDNVTRGLRDNKKWDIDDIKINLGMTRMGKYVMFTLSLPMAVLVGEKDSGKDIPEIFKPQSSSGIPPLKQPFHLLLKNLMYDEYERKEFGSTKMRRDLGATQAEMAAIKCLLTPKIKKIKNSKGKMEKYVMVCVDPLKVFHSMYTEVNDDGSTKKNAPAFECIVKSFKKIDPGNYMFTIYRVLKHSKSEGNNTDMDLDEYFRKEIGMKSYHHDNNKRR